MFRLGHLYNFLDAFESSDSGSSNFSDTATYQVPQIIDIGLEICREKVVIDLKNFESNAKALFSRFIQLVCRPSGIASLVLDMHSLLVPSGTQPVDVLYPMSSLTKRRSGRLARLILDRSKDLQQRNIRMATATQRDDIDPPCVAVIDLNEVPQHVVDRGYSVPADIHGLMIMNMILQALFTLHLYIFAPVNFTTQNWLALWIQCRYGEGLFVFVLYWFPLLLSICLPCTYAILRGDGVLTLVRKSKVAAPSHAVFLDREFTVILTGSQDVVEALAESCFSISHPITWRLYKTVSQLGLYLRHEIIKALCIGFLLTFVVGGCLAFHPSSLLIAAAPLGLIVAIIIVWSIVRIQHSLQQARLEILLGMFIIYFFAPIPPVILFLAYQVTLGEHTLFAPGPENPFHLLHYVPPTLFVLFLFSPPEFRIRTIKLFNILGNPPVRRWEFDTVAGAATFQCLVLCRGITRPIKAVDTLALLDTFVPDQTDVWMAWKRRVADRITHEVEISFAPTLPTFGDQRQQRLKELLDQAQVGYNAYRNFYDWHVPLYSTESVRSLVGDSLAF